MTDDAPKTDFYLKLASEADMPSVQDDAERNAAQAVIDATWQEVKDFE